ncbi:MAG: ribosome silencing factor [Bacilli bacterium]|nr:ribosome silencing factor [Bacilli bacterium]
MAYPKEVNIAVKTLDEHKAEEISVIKVNDITPFADYYVICSCPSERSLGAFADVLEDEYYKAGFEINNKEGSPESGWVIVDEGSVIIHLFMSWKRQEIDLESLVAKVAQKRAK